MTGQKVAGIFDAGAAFQSGFAEVTQLAGAVGDGCHERDLPPDEVRHEVGQIKDTENNGSQNRRGRAFPTLARTDNRGQLVFAELPANVISRAIAYPIQGQRKKEEVDADATEVNGETPRRKRIECAHESGSYVRKNVAQRVVAERDHE